MGCEPKGEWLPIPEIGSPCVQKLAIFALNQHFIASKEKLQFKKVIVGWYNEVSDVKIYYRLRIQAINVHGVVGLYEVEVLEEEINGKKVWKLIYFYHGIEDVKSQLIFWIIIDIKEIHVQEIAKFAVNQHNKDHNDNLVYVSIVRAFYYQVNPDSVRYQIVLKAKDCLGRVREYEADVLEEKKNKILKLELFKIVPKIC